MSERGPRHVALEEYQANLVAMAEREIANGRTKRGRLSRWRRRPALFVGVLGVGLAAGAAGASQLISSGDPVKPRDAAAPRYLPGSAHPVVVVTAPDTVLKPLWAVTIYDTPRGGHCAKAGQLRGNSVGIVAGGVFHPYGTDSPGICGRPPATGIFATNLVVPTTPSRTLVFGRTGTAARYVLLRYDAGSARTRVGQGGAFLFVLRTDKSRRLAGVYPLDKNGHRLR